jgi:hypothetical protein
VLCVGRLGAWGVRGNTSATATGPSKRGEERARTLRYVVKTAETEPAAHRRQRRKRADARVLLRLGSAAGLLAKHHSAQRQPAMTNGVGEKWYPIVLRGPREPLWECHGCGVHDNWACRTECRGCTARPPKPVLERALNGDTHFRVRNGLGARPKTPTEDAKEVKERQGRAKSGGGQVGGSLWR